MNRSERRRTAKQMGKVIQLSPAVIEAAQRLQRAKRAGLKGTTNTETLVDRAVANHAKEYQPVNFVVSDTPDQVIVSFERPITTLVLSPEKARKVMTAIGAAADLVDKRLLEKKQGKAKPEQVQQDTSLVVTTDK